MLSGPRAHVDAIAASHTVVQADYAERQASLLVRANAPIHDVAFTARPPTLEELVLAYMSAPEAVIAPGLRVAKDPTEVPA
jgi:ABC-2 type transport system ATP-binding protein